MKKLQYTISHTVKIDPGLRAVIEHHAEKHDLSLGEATREILRIGVDVLTAKMEERNVPLGLKVRC